MSRTRRAFLVGLFLLSLPAVTTRLYSSDEIQYFAYLRSLWFDRDLSFENEYRYFHERGIAASEGFHETFLERTTETGRRINFATIGCALLWAPFYAIGDGVARATGAPLDGYSKPYIAAVAYGSAVYGFLALAIATVAARQLELDGVVAAVVIWLGTPLLFYMYVAPLFAHAGSAFAVALFIYVWLRVRTTWPLRGVAGLAAAAGLMAMVREQDAFFALGACVDFALWALDRGVSRTLREKGAAIVAAAAAFAVVYAPQAAAYLVLNGHIGPHSSVGRKMNWISPHALQVLFSPAHGFFFWTPLALLALGGLFLLVRHLPPEGGSYSSYPKGGSYSGSYAKGGTSRSSPKGASHSGGQPGGSHSGGQPEGGSHSGGQPEGKSDSGGQPEGGSNSRGQPEGGSHSGGQPEGGSYSGGQRGGSHSGSQPGGSHSGGQPKGGSRPERGSHPNSGGDTISHDASSPLISRPVASGFSRKGHAALCLILMAALQIYVSGSVESWTVAGGFGQRRFIALTAILVIGYAALQAWWTRHRWPLTVITVLAVYWNLALSAEFATGLMDRQKLEPGKNAYHAFVTLPVQAPSLIYRYLFDRPSFYRGAPPADRGAGSGDRR